MPCDFRTTRPGEPARWWAGVAAGVLSMAGSLELTGREGGGTVGRCFLLFSRRERMARTSMTGDRSRSLLAELAHHHSADPLEAMHSARLSALLAAAADAMARSHFDPGHVTASAFVVHRDSRTILLHLHRRLGRWLQMGGHLDGGETPREAALREAREESGLRDLRLVTPAILDLDVHSIPAGRGEPAHLHFDVRFLVETSAPDRIAIRPDESRDLRWFGLDEAERAMGEAASSRALGKIAAVLGAGR